MRGWVAAADRRIMTRLAATDSVVLDRVLPKLSRSANNGVLWWATSCLLDLGGGPYRRAAVRGLLAMGTASFAANVVSKQLVGRTRPQTGYIPPVRRLHHPPLTTSFPSGHSASAAAFVTGVALEAPVAAVPVAVLAAGVALSRVTTGAHFPSDVLAGTALGVGVGASSLWWWPRRR